MIETKKLIEIADVIDSLHQTPEYVEEGIPMVRVTDVKPGDLLLDGCQFVTEDVFEKFTANHVPHKGDIVISRVGTYGNFAYVADDIKFCLGQNTSIIAPRINSRYLYYFLQSPFTRRQIESRVVGSTQKTLSLKNIKELEVPCPDEVTQKKIANVLETIDLKIANNNRINRNLLEQAQTLFSKYYDTAEEVEEFRILIDVLGGGTPKTSNDDYWNGSIPFFTPKDVGMPYTFQTEKSITEEGLQHCNSKVYSTNTTFVTARGTVGKVSLAGVPMAMNQSCYALASEKLPEILVYFYTLEAVKSLRHKASGAVFDAIVTRDFDTEKIRVLDYITTESFMKFASPTFEQIHMNTVENLQLHDLRDGMLPKLMSGELDISDVKI